MSSWSRPTRAFISRAALKQNLKLFTKEVRRPVMAVVKASAYGHGPAAALFLERLGVRAFGVATLDEAVELRVLGLKSELMILGAVDERYFGEAFRHRVGVTVWSLDYLRRASKEALELHLKVDTGMQRLGFYPREMPEVLSLFHKGHYGKARLSSAYTHFASADEAKDSFSAKQLERFASIAWPQGLRLHAANSAGALRYPQARLDLVRSGIFLYGAQNGVHPLNEKSRPVLTFTTRVLRVATIEKGEGVSYGQTFKAKGRTKVATLAAGYADGVPRLLSNRGEVLIQGRRCRILGRVCMDLMMVDASALPLLRPGEEVRLLGRMGREEIRAQEWADLCGTNTYEILCGISSRVPRELAA